jgi:hypothetical protein
VFPSFNLQFETLQHMGPGGGNRRQPWWKVCLDLPKAKAVFAKVGGAKVSADFGVRRTG